MCSVWAKTTWWISPVRPWSNQLTTEAGPAMRSFTWKGDVPVFDKRQSKDRFTRMAEVAVLSCCNASSPGNFTLLKHTKARKKFASTLPTETSPRCESTVTAFNGATGQPLFKRQRGRLNWPLGGVISTTVGWSRRQGRMSRHSNSKDCWKSFSLKVKRQIHWAFRNMSLRVVRSSLESAMARAKLFPSALLPSAVTRDTTSRSIDCCHRPRSIWRPGAFPCFRQDVAHKGWPACIAHKKWSATHPFRSSLTKCLKFASRRLRRLSQLYAVAPAPQRQSRRWASKVLHHSFPSLWQESRWACGNLRCLQVLFSSRRQSDKRRYVRGTACAKKTPKHLPNIYSLFTVSYSVNFNYRRLNAIGKTADTEADS